MAINNPQQKEIDRDGLILTDRTERLANKRDVAKMVKICVRSVDNYMAEGCPHIKLSPRCVRFDLADVKEWFKNQYAVQRRGKRRENRDSDDDDKGGSESLSC